MKIAVLITGQMRDSHVNYLNHMKYFIEPNNCDIFVVTSTKNFWYIMCSRDPLTFEYHLHSENSTENIKKTLKDYYNEYLKDYKIIDSEVIPDNFGTPEYYSYFINNQFTNNKEAFKLALNYEKENNIKYDLFVRLRIDKTVFPNMIKFNNNNIPIPIVTHVEPCTFFFIGNKEQMEYYCLFTYLEKYELPKRQNTFEKCLLPDPPDEIKNHILEKYKLNIIYNILTIYQIRDNKGSIGNYPYLNTSINKIGWNALNMEPE